MVGSGTSEVTVTITEGTLDWTNVNGVRGWWVGIRVNAIAPGFFVTHQNRDLLFKDGEPTPRTHKILGHTPQNRFGDVSDLIGTLLFLASDKASGFVTGVVIPVDGGFNAYSGV